MASLAAQPYTTLAGTSSVKGTIVSQELSLGRSWGREVSSDESMAVERAGGSPVSRVVSLLKSMMAKLEHEASEDEALYEKLSCWCNNNEHEKDTAISNGESRISELESSIDSLTAKVAGLKDMVKQLNEDTATEKQSLAAAVAQRDKQRETFHDEDLELTQAIENLKAAILVLSKHHASALPQFSVSFVSIQNRGPFAADSIAKDLRSLDEFMSLNGYHAPKDASRGDAQKFLQQGGTQTRDSQDASGDAEWSRRDEFVVKRALKSAHAFMQSRHGDLYYPSYKPQSAEIIGVLKQLKEEMEASFSEAKKTEIARAKAFEELRAAKTKMIDTSEKMAEQKEDELATSSNDLAEAKEDLEQETASLSETQKFMVTLKKTCSEGDTNFEERKKARLSEIQAVADAIKILMSDDARDTLSRTYSFVQMSKVTSRQSGRRHEAAEALRRAAAGSKNPTLSVLATSVELDSFERVQKAIDDMVAMLKVQQADEVQKNDWCKSELQENEMTTMTNEEHKADLQTKAATLQSDIEAFVEGISAAKDQVAQLQQDLQRASEDRLKANLEFQRSVADQVETVTVLKQALERLAKYYQEEALLQQKRALGRDTHTASHKVGQTPPVPQAEYKPQASAEGVMQMIEKLIHEAMDLTATSKKDEGAAQAAYENYVADTNASVAALMKEIATKTKNKAQAQKDKLLVEGDLVDRVEELEDLSKYNIQLHAECDYLMKNFPVRQEARSQEIEALQQAKQILSGAALA